MRTYVSTLGFHETRVTRPLLRHDFGDDDTVVLVRPAAESDSDRGADAVDYVEDMLHEIAPGADVDLERVDGSDFETAVLQCSEILQAAEGDLVVNFGGGAREIFLPLTIATVLHAPAIDTALQYTDVDQDVRQWSVPHLAATAPSNAVPTLEAIVEADSAVSVPDLDDCLDASKSSISRHVSELADRELVTTRMDGKTKYVSATLGGQLVLRKRTDR